MTESIGKPVVIQTWIIETESELAAWAETFKSHIQAPQVFLLVGQMGSGKTTLVRHLMNGLAGETASSPTFSLVNEYEYGGGVIYHFDLYRLENPEELEEIGFEEYINSNAVSLIEWPQLGLPYYDEDRTSTIRIEILPDDRRQVQWHKGIAL